MTPLERLTTASRVFVLAAIAGLVVSFDDLGSVTALLLVSLIAASSVYLSLATVIPTSVLVTVEAGLVGLVIGIALPAGVVFLPYLVILTLVGGIVRGLVGVSAVTAAQIGTVVLVGASITSEGLSSPHLDLLAPWVITGIIAGLVGSWLRDSGRLSNGAPRDDSYEAARRLLAQLRTVARRLPSGLDPVTLAAEICREVADEAMASDVAVFVRTDGGRLSPVAYNRNEARHRLSPDVSVVQDCWALGEVMNERTVGISSTDLLIAFPLRVSYRIIGVVLARVHDAPPPTTLEKLQRQLDTDSLRLEAAMTFDEVRTIATDQERRRLAREIHDGIAQELASLGYLVDELQTSSESVVQAQRLVALREELTRIVGDLRLSIFDLRSEVAPDLSLGAALSDYVRRLSVRSSMKIHLMLDEAPTRLRAETEAELLRIAGEAITNARKHARASNLWVDLVVSPPYAALEIRDDGLGLGTGREDSYGLGIMRERAQRIDGRLEIMEGPHASSRTGTTVRVTVGELDKHSDAITRGARVGSARRHRALGG